MTSGNWEGPIGTGDRTAESGDDDPFDLSTRSSRTPRLPSNPLVHTVTYLANGGNHGEVQTALTELLHAYGLELADRDVEVRGSFFQRMRFRFRRFVSSEEVAERLHKIERGFELHLLHKQQAEIDSLQSEAVAKLLMALKDEPAALIQIGSVLLVKVDGVPVVRNLTQQELRFLERNPRLLERPAEILRSLDAAVQPEPEPVLPPAAMP